MPFLVDLMIRLGKQMVDFKSYSVKRKNKYTSFIFKFCVTSNYVTNGSMLSKLKTLSFFFLVADSFLICVFFFSLHIIVLSLINVVL